MSDWSGIPIKPLARRAKRLREPFSVAPAGNTIPASRAVGLRTSSPVVGTGSGIQSPLTEQEYTGSTFYNLTSSDGFTVFEYGDETTYIDAGNDTIVIENFDPNAAP